jgi:hypothetical protein
MQTNRSLVSLVVILALAVGYLAGMVRQGSSAGTAAAGPTVITPDKSGPYLTYTGNELGTSLVVWRLTHGVPSSASLYTIERRTPPDDHLEVAHFALRPAETPR